MLGEKKDNFSLKILPVFPIKVSYKVIGLSNAIWWLFRVGENSVINHRKKKKKINMGRKLLINYCSEIILILTIIFSKHLLSPIYCLTF